MEDGTARSQQVSSQARGPDTSGSLVSVAFEVPEEVWSQARKTRRVLSELFQYPCPCGCVLRS
eukprot:2320982-Pyramimonas_sp.AAC.1